MYLISPPPKIISLLSSNIKIKKSNTHNGKTKEYIYIFDSKYPKERIIIVIAITILLGTTKLLKSVYDKKNENI